MMKALIVAALLAAGPAVADCTTACAVPGNVVFWADGYGNVTTVTLRPTIQPGAVAEVEFFNDYANNPTHNTDNVLTLGGLSVVATFRWNVHKGDDQITVTPPEGYIAVPEQLTIAEGMAGVLHIYSQEGVGY